MLTKEQVKKMRTEGQWLDNERKAWDDDSVSDLISMYFDGTDITEIAYNLQRSETAVTQKIALLNLNSHIKKNRSRKYQPNVGVCICKQCSMFDDCKIYNFGIKCLNEVKINNEPDLE